MTREVDAKTWEQIRAALVKAEKLAATVPDLDGVWGEVRAALDAMGKP